MARSQASNVTKIRVARRQSVRTALKALKDAIAASDALIKAHIDQQSSWSEIFAKVVKDTREVLKQHRAGADLFRSPADSERRDIFLQLVEESGAELAQLADDLCSELSGLSANYDERSREAQAFLQSEGTFKSARKAFDEAVTTLVRVID